MKSAKNQTPSFLKKDRFHFHFLATTPASLFFYTSCLTLIIIFCIHLLYYSPPNTKYSIHQEFGNNNSTKILIHPKKGIYIYMYACVCVQFPLHLHQSMFPFLLNIWTFLCRRLQFIQRAMDWRPGRASIHELQLQNNSILEELFPPWEKGYRFSSLEMEAWRLRTPPIQPWIVPRQASGENHGVYRRFTRQESNGIARLPPVVGESSPSFVESNV